jgi:hypothetical protein
MREWMVEHHTQPTALFQSFLHVSLPCTTDIHSKHTHTHTDTHTHTHTHTHTYLQTQQAGEDREGTAGDRRDRVDLDIPATQGCETDDCRIGAYYLHLSACLSSQAYMHAQKERSRITYSMVRLRRSEKASPGIDVIWLLSARLGRNDCKFKADNSRHTQSRSRLRAMQVPAASLQSHANWNGNRTHSSPRLVRPEKAPLTIDVIWLLLSHLWEKGVRSTTAASSHATYTIVPSFLTPHTHTHTHTHTHAHTHTHKLVPTLP